MTTMEVEAQQGNTSTSLAAPERQHLQVDTTGLTLVDNRAVSRASTQHLQDATARAVYANLPYEAMHAPVVGPAHPFSKDGIAAGMKNHRTGHVEDHNMHAFHFDDQYNTFHSYGYAVAPGSQAVVGDGDGFGERKGETVYTAAASTKRQRTGTDSQAPAALPKATRPTALPGEAWALNARQPWADKAHAPAQPTEEQMQWLEAEGFLNDKEEEGEEGAEGGEGKKRRRDKAAPAAAAIPEKSHFHGKVEVDKVTGRSWMDAPRDRRAENETCFLPKRWVHTWSGHTKGVNAIRFFPGVGHLLLSAGLDGKVKIWDVFNNQKCMRTYLGSTKGVKDIQFSGDGRRFLAASFDKVIKMWDTETGAVLRVLGEGKMFYTAKFHPEQQNTVVAGCADKKIYQWDVATGDLVQEYDYHLAAVNTITFVDEGRRFVSTSDDKTIRVWEFGIPVQIKYIADPSMHSIPAVGLHPNAQWFLGTSLDNQIVTYAARDRFRQNRKKTFKGHTVAGYACQPSMSPDGRYVLSGDGEGKLWFWDWKTTKAFRSLKAHDAVCIDAAWHPLETSKVASAGWDGLIKYWD